MSMQNGAGPIPSDKLMKKVAWDGAKLEVTNLCINAAASVVFAGVCLKSLATGNVLAAVVSGLFAGLLAKRALNSYFSYRRANDASHHPSP